MTHERSKTPAEDRWYLPKGVGVSKRLVMIGLAVLSVLVFCVVMMIFHYRKGKSIPLAQNQSRLVHQQSSLSPEAQINRVEHHGGLGDLAGHAPSNHDSHENQQAAGTSSPPLKPPENSQPVESFAASGASSSGIAVVNNYAGPSASENKVSSSVTAAYAAQDQQLNNLARDTLQNVRASGAGAHYQQQNGQSQKVAFLRANQRATHKFVLSSRLQKPLSPYELMAGTLLPATLLTGISSDLPGQITAQVSRNIYDTVTGNYLLIPQGTRVIGVYDSKVAYGQSRVLIAWSRLIFPNGESFDLQGQPGVDLMGMAGLHDTVNNHYVRIFGSALAFSIFGALGQLSQPQQAYGGYPSNAQIIYGAIGQNLTQAATQLTEKNMNIQPTITIRPGANFNILLTRDMVLPGSYRGLGGAGVPTPGDITT